MKAYLVRTTGERELRLTSADGIVIQEDIEENGLFSFRAPVCQLTIWDELGELGPDGSDEIVRGDEIVVREGTTTVFRGRVDLGIEQDDAAGTIRFSALGWLAELKDVILGIDEPFATGSRIPGYPIGPIDDDGRPDGTKYFYRYVKTESIEEEDGSSASWEWSVWPYTYETVWAATPSRRIGYRKVYRFDSDGGLGYIETYYQQTSWEMVESGVFRRRVGARNLQPVDFQTIAETVIRQAGKVTGQNYSLVWSPGEVRGDLNVQMGDVKYEAWRWKIANVGGNDELYLVAWPKITSWNPWDFKGNEDLAAAMRHVISGSSFEEKASLDFADGWELARANGYGSQFSWTRWMYSGTGKITDFNKLKRLVLIDQNMALVIMFWSWLSIDPAAYKPDPERPDEQTPGYKWGRNATAHWYRVDLDTGRTTEGSYLRNSRLVYEESPVWPETNPPATPADPPEMLDAVTIDEAEGTATFSSGGRAIRDLQDDLEIVWDGARYYVFDGLPFVGGNLAMNRAAMAYENVTAGQALLDICKLTNSRLSVSHDRAVHIVARDWSRTERRADLLLGFSRTRRSYWGERTPQISSGIVVNESHLSALRQYYADEYFPTEEDGFRAQAMEDAATAAAALLDEVVLIWKGEEVRFTVESIVRRGGGGVEFGGRN